MYFNMQCICMLIPPPPRNIPMRFTKDLYSSVFHHSSERTLASSLIETGVTRRFKSNVYAPAQTPWALVKDGLTVIPSVN